MKSSEELKQLLRKIDHKSYPAYKETRGAYQFGTYVLSIDHVQGDPFASPSKVSIHVPARTAGFPAALYDTKEKRIALQDFLLRQFGRKMEAASLRGHEAGSGKSGLLCVSRCGQEILERSACQIDREKGSLIVRMEVGFPARGRTICSQVLEEIFFELLPVCIRQTLSCQAYQREMLEQVAHLAEDQQYIREQLKEQGLVAFVANGSILPRETGVSRRPMKGAVPFYSPGSMEIDLELPHYGTISGMGIPKGVTVIIGGGYHGKSTLLKAIEAGVYNHIAGDGREYVITDDTAMKIRAEDGRSIRNVDISMFINHLPNGKDTKGFFTEDASGSTSQAAGMVEAMEAGAKVFLIDEDTSATNFMIRDELMQMVVCPESEPITPFVDRVRELYEVFGISTILVAGSSGSYFSRADVVVQMNCYKASDVTQFAWEMAARYVDRRETLTDNCGKGHVESAVKRESAAAGECIAAVKENNAAGEQTAQSVQSADQTESTTRGQLPDFYRCPLGTGASGQRGSKAEDDHHRVKIKTTGRDSIFLDKELIDMRYVEQVTDNEQMVTLGHLLWYTQNRLFDGNKTMRQAVEAVYALLEQEGPGAICEGNTVPGNLAMPRKQELYACLNRYRKLRFEEETDNGESGSRERGSRERTGAPKRKQSGK